MGVGWLQLDSVIAANQSIRPILSRHGIRCSSWPSCSVRRGGLKPGRYYERAERHLGMGRLELDGEIASDQSTRPGRSRYGLRFRAWAGGLVRRRGCILRIIE